MACGNTLLTRKVAMALFYPFVEQLVRGGAFLASGTNSCRWLVVSSSLFRTAL